MQEVRGDNKQRAEPGDGERQRKAAGDGMALQKRFVLDRKGWLRRGKCATRGYQSGAFAKAILERSKEVLIVDLPASQRNSTFFSLGARMGSPEADFFAK